MDYELAIEHVRRFKAYCEIALAIQDQHIHGFTHLSEWNEADEGIRAELPFVEAAAQIEAPHLVPALRAPDMVITHYQKDQAAHELLVMLRSRDELARMVGDSGSPSLSATDLNERIWSAASRWWESGNEARAVRSAAEAVFDVLRDLLETEQASLEALCDSFLADPPTIGSSRIRVSQYRQESPEYDAAQASARQLGLLCAALARGGSLLLSPDSEQAEAFECLALLSRFARLIESARLERFG